MDVTVQEEESFTPKLRDRITESQSKEKNPKPFNCEKCEYKATNFDDIYSHTGSVHMNNTETNDTESIKDETDKNGLLQENTLVPSNGEDIVPLDEDFTDELTCKECGQVISSEEECQDHIKTHAGNVTLINPPNPRVSCGICGKAFYTLGDCNNHMDSCYAYSCRECQFKCDDKRVLKEHMGTSHSITSCTYACKDCQFKADENSTLNEHIQMHHNDTQTPKELHPMLRLLRDLAEQINILNINQHQLFRRFGQLEQKIIGNIVIL